MKGGCVLTKDLSKRNEIIKPGEAFSGDPGTLKDFLLAIGILEHMTVEMNQDIQSLHSAFHSSPIFACGDLTTTLTLQLRIDPNSSPIMLDFPFHPYDINTPILLFRARK
jgi:hypothetical protein